MKSQCGGGQEGLQWNCLAMATTYRYHEQGNHVEDAEIDKIKQFRVVHFPIDYANRFHLAVAQIIVHRVHEYEFRDRVQRRSYPHAGDYHLWGEQEDG